MFRTTTAALCGACMAALVAPAFAAEWMTDLDAARARAAAEGKAVLVNFTGSDWCPWCIQMKQDVFDKPAFERYARDKFVLMEVDVPQSPSFDQKQMERNLALSEQFRVSGYPTVMVMTPAGEVVGGFVNARQSVPEARVPLDAALANAAALKAADALKGDAKVKALYAVYEKLPPELRASSTLRERIAGLDRRNLTGIQDEIKAQAQMDELMARLKDAGQDTRQMLGEVEETLQKALPKNRPALLELKGNIQLMAAQTEDDVLAAKKTLLEMADAIPEKAAAIRAQVERSLADPARVLRDIRQRRGE